MKGVVISLSGVVFGLAALLFSGVSTLAACILGGIGVVTAAVGWLVKG